MAANGNGHSQHRANNKRISNSASSVENSEDIQRRFLDSVLQGKEFSEAEKSTAKLQSVDQFREHWKAITAAKQDFDDKHEGGCGLCVRRYQESSETVMDFMDEFSPILDTIKEVAPGYGGLAVATISVVFVVAQNKNGIEKTLASTIETIRDRLPGLDLYRHIYDENHVLDNELQAKIIFAYETFIDFCISATEYYKGRGVRRWIGALGPPRSFNDSANRVQESIGQIRRLGEELVAKNVDQIKKTNEEQKIMISALRDQLTNQDVDEFRQCFQLVGITDESRERDFNGHRYAVAEDEHINAKFLQQMRGPQLEKFISEDIYQQWELSENPRLLILYGHNYVGLGSSECWLSWVAISTIQRLRSSAQKVYCAYHAIPERGEPLFKMLPNILLQLLSKKRNILSVESRRDALRAELHAFQREESPDEFGYGRKTEVLYKIARQIVNFFDESETVYIVVDRADRCVDPRARYDHRTVVVDGLAEMVQAARCRLKILLVVDGSSCEVMERKSIDRIVCHTIHQKPVSSMYLYG